MKTTKILDNACIVLIMTIMAYNTIQLTIYIVLNISQRYHSEAHYKSAPYNITSIYTLYTIVDKYVSNLSLNTAR